MKNFITLAAMAAVFVISISSCAKEDTPEENLTASIVGVFLGDVDQDGTPYTDQSITVTKLSNTKIQVKPTSSSDDRITTFTADVTKVATGQFKLTVIPFTDSGGNTVGGHSNVANDATLHGTYIESSGRITYSLAIILANGNPTIRQDYSGVKQ